MKIFIRYPSPKSSSSGEGLTIAITWLKVLMLFYVKKRKSNLRLCSFLCSFAGSPTLLP